MVKTLPKYKHYPAYRPSGVELLGEIPSHWEVRRLKYLATLNDEALPENTDPDTAITYVDIGNVDSVRGITGTEDLMFEDAPSRARRIVRQGDIIISTVRTYLKAIARIDSPDVNLIVSTGFAVIRPRHLDDGFVAYALSSPYFVERVVAHSVGVSYPAINSSELACLDIAFPPSPEQQAIAAFLDRETARIDALVAKKERLVELLQEKRTALITRTVTRGLESDVQMKDSGVEWLGDIPAHWEVRKLKVMVPGITVGIVVTPSRYYVDQGVPCLRSLNIAHGRISTEDLVFISEESNLLHKKSQIFADDVLIVRTGRAGAAVVVPPELDGANCIDLLIVRRSERLLPQFLYYVMNSRVVGAQVSVDSVGAIQEHYNTATLSNLRIPCVPKSEQRAIAGFLDRETTKLDTLIARIREAIDRLRELRIALISAAVTGRIDVREEAG